MKNFNWQNIIAPFLKNMGIIDPAYRVVIEKQMGGFIEVRNANHQKHMWNAVCVMLGSLSEAREGASGTDCKSMTDR